MPKPAALLLYLLVLAVFGGGAIAYAGFEKTVRVSIDGQSRMVHTFARTVGGVLQREKLAVGAHDVVQPAMHTHVGNGARIELDRGRPMHVIVDGHPRVVWVTARTVGQALEQLGLSNDGAYISASVSAPVPLSGLGLVVRMPHLLTFLHDGKATRIVTTVPTIKEAIAVAHVRLGAHDRVSVPLSSLPYNREIVTITRVSTSHDSVTLPIAYAVVRVADANLYKGTSRVIHPGRYGLREKRYDIVHVNGHLTKRVLVYDKVLRQPMTRVVHYGTKPKPTYGSYVGGGVDELNWYALAGCESNHNPQAYSPRGPYYGLYQFAMSSWQIVGGQGDPRNASVDEQTYRAKLLYKRAGDSSPWPTCGHYLYQH